MRRFYPRGKPEDDVNRLNEWLKLELKAAGAGEDFDLEGEPYEDDTEEWSRGKKIFQSMVLNTEQLSLAFSYQARVNSAPWPLQMWIRTTGGGVIAQVIYWVRLPKKIPNEFIFFKRRIVLRGKYYGFEGENTERLEANEDLKNKLYEALSIFYQWKGAIYSAGDQVSFVFQPQGDETDVWAYTTLRPASKLLHALTISRSRLTFGMKELFVALRALEASL